MWLSERVPWEPRGGTVLLNCACGAVSEASISWCPSAEDVGRDPVLGCDLFLRATVRGHVLWAWNQEHLSFLKGFVSATLREREPNRNGSLASRLPVWMTSAKNRDAVVAAIDALERRLASARQSR